MCTHRNYACPKKPKHCPLAGSSASAVPSAGAPAPPPPVSPAAPAFDVDPPPAPLPPAPPVDAPSPFPDNGFDDDGGMNQQDIPPSKYYLDFQKKIVELRTPIGKAPFKTGRVKDGDDNYFWPSWKTYADVFIMQTTIGLSDAQTEQTTACYQAIAKRGGLKDGLQIPKTARAIRDTVTDNMREHYEVKERNYFLDEDFFMPGELYATGHTVNLLQVVAEQLLDVCPDTFHLRHEPIYNKAGDQCFRGPASAQLYKEYYDTVQRKHGENTYPLCIMISGDDLALNKTQTAGACPWYVHMANLGDDEYMKGKNIDCIAYSPTKLFTDAELGQKLLPVHQGKGVSAVSDIIEYSKYKFDLKFLDDVLEPLLEYEDEGIFLQVGPDPTKIVHFVPLLFMFVMDSKEANHYQCIRAGPSSHNTCRICYNRCGKGDTFTARTLRDNKTMEKIMTEGEEVISYDNSLTN
jgi:hypothetical protein